MSGFVKKALAADTQNDIDRKRFAPGPEKENRHGNVVSRFGASGTRVKGNWMVTAP